MSPWETVAEKLPAGGSVLETSWVWPKWIDSNHGTAELHICNIVGTVSRRVGDSAQEGAKELAS